MISIIICSKSPLLLKVVSDNIKETIGVPYQIIVIDNSEGKYGICKAYNIGAAQANYDIFCFAHEDILFVTQNWGQKVVNHLKDESIGLIGTLGGDPIVMLPVINSNGIIKAEVNMIFVDVNTKIKTHFVETQSPNNLSLIKETTGIDGTIMITRRTVFNEFKFDDIVLTNFHGYDIDYSLQVQTKYKVCVIFDVLLEHYFKGGANRFFVDENLKLCKKWKKHLPVSFQNHTHGYYKGLHWVALKRLMLFMLNLEYDFTFILKQFFNFSNNRFFSLKSFFTVLLSIIYVKAKMVLSKNNKIPSFFKLICIL